MLISNADRQMLRLNLQFFGEDNGGTTAAGATTDNAATANTAATATDNTAAQSQTENVLSSEEIQRLIQSTVDSKTAALGKTIADLKKENELLKKATMTAEEIQKADREELEKQKAEVNLQQRQIYAHRAVATAGYGENADAVVDIVLGDTDEKTDERLKNFKTLIDKIVAETVQKTFEKNGRVPNGAKSGGGSDNQEHNIAAEIGKKKAAQDAKSNEILKHYYGG